MADKFTKKLTLLRIASALSLFFENAARTFWRIDVWILFFIGLWLLQIPAFFGNIIATGLSLTFIAGLFYFLYKDARLFAWPSRADIDRHIEERSQAKHRPLKRLADNLANPEKDITQRLWRLRENNLNQEVNNLEAPTPRPILAGLDPKSSRIFVLLFCLIGIVIAGPQWPERLTQGLFPFQNDQAHTDKEQTLLWIIPPKYTGLGQTIIEGKETTSTSIDLIEGSKIKIRIPESWSMPSMRMGSSNYAFKKEEDNGWALEIKAQETSTLEIRQLFKKSLTYKVNYIKDMPPEIKITGEIEELGKGALQIPLTVKDDFGVTDLTLHMDLAKSIEDKPLGNAFIETRGVMSLPAQETELGPVYDLTWHPWAGLPVTLSIGAKDHKGQAATAKPLEILLPERSFHHPVARQLIEMRKRLLWSPEAAQSNISYELNQIMVQIDKYNYDKLVFLSLRSMASRLTYSSSLESAVNVIEQLWDTALRIEDGNLTLAARNLREAQQELEKLLRDPQATNEQIAQAMQNLRMAMAQYFQEIAQELQRHMIESGQQPLSADMLSSTFSPEDIAAFLDQMQAHALSGDRQTARELLSQLQQAMDRVDQSMGGQMTEEMQTMMEGIEELKELIERQKSLLEKVKDIETEATTPEAEEQETIRKMLGEVMLKAHDATGQIPDKMSKAEREMHTSVTQLSQNQPVLAVPHQEKALEYLQESQEEMQQQLMTMMQKMMMMSFGMGQTDPLGRPLKEGNEGESLLPSKHIKIPDKADRKNAREILKIIRQKSSDRQRPSHELEYYRRLMKQF